MVSFKYAILCGRPKDENFYFFSEILVLVPNDTKERGEMSMGEILIHFDQNRRKIDFRQKIDEIFKKIVCQCKKSTKSRFVSLIFLFFFFWKIDAFIYFLGPLIKRFLASLHWSDGPNLVWVGHLHLLPWSFDSMAPNFSALI